MRDDLRRAPPAAPVKAPASVLGKTRSSGGEESGTFIARRKLVRNAFDGTD